MPDTRPTYYAALAAVHRHVSPRVYVEIGVHQGHSLSLASATTRCIGIDPMPDLRLEPPPNTTILATTSDQAFASGAVDRALCGAPIDLVFIDGLHLFEQVLRDIAAVERRCTAASVILVHDCLPIDAVTSARDRTTVVWSGDVWKAIPALRSARPDLRITTLDVAPTGLGIITCLDPSSRVLGTRHDDLVAELLPQGYDDLLSRGRDELLAVVSVPGTVDDAVARALTAA